MKAPSINTCKTGTIVSPWIGMLENKTNKKTQTETKYRPISLLTDHQDKNITKASGVHHIFPSHIKRLTWKDYCCYHNSLKRETKSTQCHKNKDNNPLLYFIQLQ